MIGPTILKDWRLLLADRHGMMALFVLPVVFIAVFGAVFQPGAQGPSWTIAAFGQGPAAAELVTALGDVASFEVDILDSENAVAERVAAREADVGLVIPADFSPMTGTPATVYIDGAMSPQVRGPIMGTLESVLARKAFGVGQIKLTAAVSPPGMRPAVKAGGFQLSVPGNVVLFGFFLALTVALSFTEDRRSGVWRRMLASPVPSWTFVVGKLIPFVFVGAVQFGFLFGVAFLAFGLELGGSLVALVVLCLAVVVCAVCLGLLIASMGGSEKQVGGAGSISLLILGLLGGAMVPRLAMPETMQSIGLFTPHGWALEGYYELLLREGGGLADIALPAAALVGFGCVFAGLGAWRFRWQR